MTGQTYAGLYPRRLIAPVQWFTRGLDNFGFLRPRSGSRLNMCSLCGILGADGHWTDRVADPREGQPAVQAGQALDRDSGR